MRLGILNLLIMEKYLMMSLHKYYTRPLMAAYIAIIGTVLIDTILWIMKKRN